MRFFMVLLIALLPGWALAQDSAQAEADKGFITRLLQDNLSGAGRTVTISGFQGALSSRASMDRLTIADEAGVWLTIEEAVLTWDRSRLLRAEIDITEMTAARIIVARQPVGEPDAPSPEAGSFALPRLPVALRIGTLKVPELALGKSILGVPATLSLTGQAALDGLSGSAAFDLVRTDGQTGEIRFSGAFSDDSTVLALDLEAREGAGGLVATLAGLPGRPALGLTLKGEDPITDFTAALRLATDGEERLGGTVTVDLQRNDIWRLRGALEGDLTPLLPETQRAFFAGTSKLTFDGTRAADGALTLERFDLATGDTELAGQVALSPEFWPVSAKMTGQMARRDGAPVPLPGGEGSLRRAVLDLSYDAARGDGWQGRAEIAALNLGGLGVGDLSLAGEGTLVPARSAAEQGRFSGDLTLAARQITALNPALAQAIGPELTGGLSLALSGTQGRARLTDLALRGADYRLTGGALIDGIATGLQTETDLHLSADDLGRFGPLLGRSAKGAAELALTGTVVPLTGAFDLRIDGTGRDLGIGQAQVDRLMVGQTDLLIKARRTTEGLALDDLTLANSALALKAAGRLSSRAGHLDYSAQLADIALVQQGVATGAGRADLSGAVVLGESYALRKVTARGRLRPDLTGTRVRIGLAEAAGGTLDLGFAGETGRWTGEIALEDTRAARFTTRRTALRGGGDIVLTEDGGLTRATAELALEAEGLATDDPALGRAIGAAPRLTSRIVYAPGAPLAIEALDVVGEDYALRADATLDTATEGLPLTFSAALDAAALSRFSALVGTPLRGAANLRAEGSAEIYYGNFTVTAEGTTQNVGIGQSAADALLRGQTRLSLAAARQGGALRIDQLAAANGQMRLTANGSGPEGITFDALLNDVGLLTSELSGAATLRGTARQEGRDWVLKADATGPGGTEATLSGRRAASGLIDAEARGTAPLGLANRRLAPRRVAGILEFALALNGRAALENVTGRISTRDAVFSAPTLRQSIEKITAEVTLSEGRALIDLSGRPAAGGRLTISGPITLSGGMQADIRAALDSAKVVEPGLYAATVSGRMRLAGPLAGGAKIKGRITVDSAEVQVPETGLGGLGDLPPIRHVSLRPKARATLARAGLGLDGRPLERAAQTSQSAAFPLDLKIEAPGRIFVRGRGLDAELGGAMRILGTTSEMLPQGAFELIRGRLSVLTQRFDLTEGLIQITGDFDPFLRLIAETQKGEYLIRTIVQGAVSDPKITFESQPDLPQEEVLALLLFGRDFSKLTPFQAVQLGSAVATLAGRGGEGIMSKLRKGLALDDLDLTTDADGNAAVRAGKYISKNVYTDVVIGSEGNSAVNLNIDLNKMLTAKGGVRADGNTSVGLYYQRDY